MRLTIHLSYLDLGRGQWILAEDPVALPAWRDAEQHARQVFDSTYGLAQEIGAGLRPRLVFGWSAFRELLTTDSLGLDPVKVELLKLVLLRTVRDPPPIAEGTELRLIGSSGVTLEFAWVEGADRKIPVGFIGQPNYLRPCRCRRLGLGRPAAGF